MDPDEGDTLEVRVGRDRWRDVTDQEGRRWDLDYQIGRLHLYRRLIRRAWFDDPTKRILRITYRYGPLGEDVKVDDEGLVESVPPDVQDAVAARAAMRLALDDNTKKSMPDDGQLTDRASKRSALKEEWDDITSRYSGFSTV